jgi:hypothetical protein
MKMPNWVIKLVKEPVKKMVIARIKDPDIQKDIIARIAKKVDIPKLTPEQEAKFWNTTYDAVEEVLVEIVEAY